MNVKTSKTFYADGNVMYELVTAKKYYGSHATGMVLLRNGRVEFHGNSREARDMFNDITRLKS